MPKAPPHSRGRSSHTRPFPHGHTSALLPLRQGQGVINMTSRSAQGLGVFFLEATVALLNSLIETSTSAPKGLGTPPYF